MKIQEIVHVIVGNCAICNYSKTLLATEMC